MSRLSMLLEMNPDFMKAFARGEDWAIRRARAVNALDDPTTDFDFDGLREPDGMKKNRCGSCPYRDGCMVCDLPHDPTMKDMIGTIAHYKITCSSCDFRDGTECTSGEEAIRTREWSHRHHNRRCMGTLKAMLTKDPFAAR